MAHRPLSRKALYIPFVIAIAAAAAWSYGWFRLRDAAVEQMDSAANDLRAHGYVLSWDERAVSGFPFRLDVDLTDFRLGEPSGWSVAAPVLRTEAYAYAPTHWVAVAPQGVILNRPIGGALAIRGKALRASLTDFDRDPPRIAIEGADLTFTPIEGGRPYPLQSVERLNLHVRPGPDDQGAVLFRAENARANLPGMLERLGRDRPVTIDLEVIFSKISAMHGRGWRSMAQSWTGAGGAMTVQTASLETGGGVLAAHGGPLTISPDGRVAGSLTLDLDRAGEALSDVTGGLIPPAARFGGAPLTLADGETRLGPFAIAPAPKAY